MEKPNTRAGARVSLADFLAGNLSQVGLEQLRLDRLFELRALIDSLRSGHDRPRSADSLHRHHS